MTNYNDEIWAAANADGTATIVTGKTAPTGARKVSGMPSTVKDMAKRIATRNGESFDFADQDAAEAALAAEETARLAGL